jgi:uncharacterized repeat protein (TIGR03803 family)
MSKFNLGMRACGVLLLWSAAAMALPAQTTAVAPAVTFTTLHTFDKADGKNPKAVMFQASNGDLYGTTYAGGSDAGGVGTAFKFTPSGKLMTVARFGGTDGDYLPAPLVQGTDGNLYGTALEGGRGGADAGTVFRIIPSGKLEMLHSFHGTEGGSPYAGLVQEIDGDFYGTTSGGGTGEAGTVFKITSSGILTTLHSFDGTDGAYPYAGLVQGTDGNFYGTTIEGGANNSCVDDQGLNCGTIFKITPDGMLTTLHSFGGADGINPFAALVQATDGNFYGTTRFGEPRTVARFSKSPLMAH